MPRKPRESIDRPPTLKLVIGGVAILLLGGFIWRVVSNERRLIAEVPVLPEPVEEEISLETIAPEEIQTHCQKVAATNPRNLCKLKMPSIGAADVRVVNVGTEQKEGRQSIGSPNNIYDAAWWTGSVRPGENGATFLDGHSSNLHPAIFNRLIDLTAGAIITLERADGQLFDYQVTEAKRLSLEDANRWVQANLGTNDPLRGANGRNVLYLMTCVGAWNLNQQTMTERVLVQAELVNSR